MKLEKLVCSVELSMCLAELKVAHDNYFLWQQIGNSEPKVVEDWAAVGFEHPNALHIPTFTSAELAEHIPGWFLEKINKIENGHWQIPCIGSEIYKTEADARATLLIWLLNTKQVKRGGV